jgi:hypothetical protein
MIAQLFQRVANGFSWCQLTGMFEERPIERCQKCSGPVAMSCFSNTAISAGGARRSLGLISRTRMTSAVASILHD